MDPMRGLPGRGCLILLRSLGSSQRKIDVLLVESRSEVAYDTLEFVFLFSSGCHGDTHAALTSRWEWRTR